MSGEFQSAYHIHKYETRSEKAGGQNEKEAEVAGERAAPGKQMHEPRRLLHVESTVDWDTENDTSPTYVNYLYDTFVILIVCEFHTCDFFPLCLF